MRYSGRPVTTALAALTAATLTAACGPADRAGDALAGFRDTRPGTLAGTISAYGDATVSAADVKALATRLCGAGYDPAVAVDFLREQVRTRSVLLLRPMALVTRAAAQGCPTGLTPALERAVGDAVWSALDVRTAPAGGADDAPQDGSGHDSLARQVCGAVRAAGVTALARALAKLASDDVLTDVVLGVAIEVAARTCPVWLDEVVDAVGELRARI